MFCIFSRRGLAALSILIEWAMRRPEIRDRQKYRLPCLFYFALLNQGRLSVKIFYMKIVVTLLLSFLLISCGSGGIDASKFLAERDSILNVNEQQQKELDHINFVMTEVAACLDSIAEHEQFLYTSKEGVKLSRPTVLENLRSFEQLLNRQRKQIAMLQDSLYQCEDSTSRYLKLIEFLNQELAEKDLTIQSLQKELTINRKNIAELQELKVGLEKNVSDLLEKEKIHKQALEVQSYMLNECYVKVGTKKELQNAGLLVSKGLFSKTKVNNSNLDKNLFMKVDIRNFQELPIKAKKIKIMTPEPPQSSYCIEKTINGLILRIQDPTTFWNASNYLIIQTN